jgi:hypothetical protein
MDIHFYRANSPAEAFEVASKDTKKWGFPEMDALTEMARLLRDGYEPRQDGMAKSCFCSRGWFKLFGPEAKGYGIALVQLQGHEVGIADDAAQEVLDHHREHRGEEMYAEALMVCAEHISSIEDLDAAYEKLLAGNLIVKTGKTVTVTDGDKKHQRPAYRVR